MGYYRNYHHYRRRKFDAMQYYAHPSVHTHFAAIISDLKEFFFSLSEEQLSDFMALYTKKYGKSAGSYARKTYPDWKSNMTRLSDQTLMRLIEYLPPFLSSEQRIFLLRKIVESNQSAIYGVDRSIDTDWNSYIQVIRAIRSYIPQRIDFNNSLVLKSIQISDEIKNIATWLYADDMVYANMILQEMYLKNVTIIFANALHDLDNFENTCNRMYREGLIYNDLRFSIKLPAQDISITVHKLKKGYCFVATACFGTEAPETNLFRIWRDQVLQKHSWGLRFIEWYYRNGRAIADFLNAHSILKNFVKWELHLFYRFLLYWRNHFG